MDYTGISHLIEDQFPSIYKEDGELMIQFTKAYYEFVNINYAKNKNILNDIDVDATSEEFIAFFKNTYLSDFPFISSSDAKFLVKHIIDFYRSKGTIESTKLLIRLLFGIESDVYIPSNDIFKPSDSKWILPRYVEITRSSLSASFIGKEVIGSISGAKAIVEGLVTKRVDGKYIDVLYLSAIRGFFIKNDRIQIDGQLIQNAPVVLGSLNRIEITNGGRNNRVGDIFDIQGLSGKSGKARISSIFSETGRVNFTLEEGGSGYTATERTDVYVSDAVISLENESFEFIRFETVSQKLEDLKLLSIEDIKNDLDVGKFITGVNENGIQVANGTILDITIAPEPSSNIEYADVKVLVNSGTFDRQERITLTSPVSFIEGEIIEEESTTVISLSSPTGTFSVGDRVEQVQEVNYDTLTANLILSGNTDLFQLRETVVQYNANNELSVSAQVINKFGSTLKVRNIRSFAEPGEFISNTDITGLDSAQTLSIVSVDPENETKLYTSFAFGFVDAISGSDVTLKPSWGIFNTESIVNAYANTDISSSTILATSAVGSVDIPVIGARGQLSTQASNNEIIVENIFGEFTAGNNIRGDKTKNVGEILTIGNEGATDIWLEGISTANGIIDLVANTSATAIVIDQNSSSVGVSGNNNPFFSSGQISIEDSLREITNITVNILNQAVITTNSDHGYIPGDFVLLDVNLQQNDEVKSIQGIYEVITTPLTNTLTLAFSEPDLSIIQQGNFAFFFTSIQKTVIVPIETDRSLLISPPRNANGTIVEVSKGVVSVSTGDGADFSIGSLENEETVFLATDLIGGNNAIGVPYLNIRIDGSNSGIGFVDSAIIDSPGSGFSNGEVIDFIGGGFAGGQPTTPAQGIILTDGLGSLLDIQIVNHGQGYWNTPTISWPGGNISANVEIVMDYGYGFPKSPNGDKDNLLIDLWTTEPFTIGTISSLSSVNPGQNYNQDPFVLVYNRYVAGFRRSDFLLTVANLSGSYAIGEILSEEVPGAGGVAEVAKGFVLATSGDQIIVRRTSFNTSFTDGFSLLGETSGATSDVVSVESVEGSFVMGDNAIVDADVISAQGIAAEAEIIDSGFGYEDGEEVTLSNSSSIFITQGIANVNNQGIGSGYWNTKNSHINSNSKIHDNRYYQEFSYDIITGESLNRYEVILKQILHVAGTELFGTIEKKSEIDVAVGSNSEITIF